MHHDLAMGKFMIMFVRGKRRKRKSTSKGRGEHQTGTDDRGLIT